MPSVLTAAVENMKIAAGIHRLCVRLEHPEAKPGQFYMLRREKSAVLLPRAISLCDKTDDTLVFLVQNAGPGTDELCDLRPGDMLRVTGPLGNGFPLDAISGRIALIGGGIGVAPLLLTAKELSRRKMSADCFLGFRDEPFLQENFLPYANSLSIATESGRAGQKGLVTALFLPEDYDFVLCCGPEAMMKAVTGLCKAAGVPAYVSLENKMACGIGGCLVCACADKNGKNLRACKDGPVFLGEEIRFD